MKAVLLAAGHGTRLAPLTSRLPKILVPVAGEPLLARQLRYLAASGVDEVRLNAHHHAAQVEGFLRATKAPLRVSVSVEEEVLGTAGALLPMRAFLDEPFVLLYGDVLTNADLGELLGQHTRAGALATISHYEAPSVEGKSLVTVDGDRVTGFVEKPTGIRGPACTNAGIYALDPGIIRFVAPGSDFGHDVWPALIAARHEIRAFDLGDAYVRDVGTWGELKRAETDLIGGRVAW
jgi:mannose-1-phosphate guanylyltransferase